MTDKIPTKFAGSKLFRLQLQNWLLVLILIIGLGGGSFYYFSYLEITKRVGESLEYRADSYQQSIEKEFTSQTQWMNTLATDTGFMGSVEVMVRNAETYGFDSRYYKYDADIMSHQQQYLFLSTEIDESFILNKKGKLIYSYNSLKEMLGEDLTESGFYGTTPFSEAFTKVLKTRKTAISRYMYIQELDRSTILIGVPIFSSNIGDESNIQAVLLMPFNIDWVKNLTSDNSGLGKTGEVLLMQRILGAERGAVAVINQFRDKNDNNPGLECLELRQTQPKLFSMTRAFRGEEDSGWMLDAGCDEVYSAGLFIHSLDIGLVVKMDRDEVLESVDNLKLYSSILFMLLLLLLALVVIRQTTLITHPIERLIKKAGDSSINNFEFCKVLEINKLAYALQERESQVNKANKAKDDFLASMSHELRTPITTIIGNSDFLSASKLDREQTDMLQAIEVSGMCLLNLVNDILDNSKISSGKFNIDDNPYILNKMLNDINHIFLFKAKEADITFTVKDTTKLKRKLLGDSKRIGQILINLLSNAVKFTEKGRVTLTVWQTDEESLHFEVVDTGIGMNQETLNRLFKPYEQADSSISQRFGGTGLGLNISWRLAELMHGTINVQSELNKGSKFELVIPLRLTNIDIAKKTDKATPKQVEFTGKTILAEDNAMLKKLICRILEQKGLEVTIASNGIEAVEIWQKNKSTDLIFMDMEMPEMNGIDATRELRKIGCETPIVAMTGNVLPIDQNRFFTAGGNDFIGKPIDKELLNEVLTRYLS